MIDALTVRAIGAELTGAIAGGRVQQLYFVAPQVVGFEVYANHNRHYVLASVETQRARLLLITDKLRNASVPLTPFLLLLKKYVTGAFVNRIQVVKGERILRIEFDHREQGISTLVIELVGNRANMILLDAGGIILDAQRRVPATMNRAREIVPRAKYLPPPAQAKVDPLSISAAELHSALEKAKGETLADRLVASVAGTSPLFARELAYRATHAIDAPFSGTQVPRVYEELTRVWRSPALPALGMEHGEPVAVAAFSLTHLDVTEDVPSMSAALQRFFGAEESYEAVKVPLRAQIRAALDRLVRMRASLERELVSADEIENLKLKGEMILGYQYSLVPAQSKLHAQVTEELALDIALDPALSPVENANKYFDEYKRARDAQIAVPERITSVANDIAFAEQILNDLDNAELRAEIDMVMDEARAANLIRETGLRSGGHAPRAEPRQFTSPDGLQVLVGRNASQNDALTFERAKPDDLWLHARGQAGAHVVILSNGAHISEATLEYAAGLAAYYSQARNENAVDVVYAPRRSVHRVRGPGAHPGLVTVREEKVIRVQPIAVEA